MDADPRTELEELARLAPDERIAALERLEAALRAELDADDEG